MFYSGRRNVLRLLLRRPTIAPPHHNRSLSSIGFANLHEFDAGAFVRSAVPHCTGFSIHKEQVMGFSGARVAELRLQTSSGPRNVFLKVVALPTDPSGIDHWRSELESYANECAFLSDARFARKLRVHGALIPETFKVQVLPGQYFATLQECMTEEYMLLPVHPAARTWEVLRWLAAFHSTFFGCVPADHGLLDVGTHVHLDRHPASELDALNVNFNCFCTAFADEYPFFARPETLELGSRLQAVAKSLAHHLRPGLHNAHHTTLVHGDFKGANYFLKKDGAGVVGFDWQWTGPGIGATDLIYLFCGSVEDEIVDDFMPALHLYYEALDLDKQNYVFEKFLADFQVAALDYARWAFSVRLVGDTPATFRQRARNIDVNVGYFRRHLPRVQWLLQLVEKFLPLAESGQLFFRHSSYSSRRHEFGTETMQ